MWPSERPLSAGMRAVLESSLSSTRIVGPMTLIIAWGFVALSVFMALIVTPILLLVALKGGHGEALPFAFAPLLMIAFGIVVAIFMGRTVSTRKQQLEQDLSGGVFLEVVGDPEVGAIRNSRALVLRLPDRTLDLTEADPYGSLPWNRSKLVPGVTVRFTPNASVVLEVAASDGQVLYRPKGFAA